MLTPVVVPLPVAVAVAAALALAFWWLRQWLETTYPLAFAPVRPAPAPTRATGGRHRIGAPDAYRPHQGAEYVPVVASLAPLTDAERLDRALPMPVAEPAWRAADTETFLVTEQEYAAAYREDWARERVAAAGHSWATHMAKFSGAVVEREQPLPQRTPGEALAAEIAEGVYLPEPTPIVISAPPAVNRVHPSPCGYPDLLPCICSVQQAEGVEWFGVPDDDTRELETV